MEYDVALDRLKEKWGRIALNPDALGRMVENVIARRISGRRERLSRALRNNAPPVVIQHYKQMSDSALADLDGAVGYQEATNILTDMGRQPIPSGVFLTRLNDATSNQVLLSTKTLSILRTEVAIAVAMHLIDSDPETRALYPEKHSDSDDLDVSDQEHARAQLYGKLLEDLRTFIEEQIDHAPPTE